MFDFKKAATQARSGLVLDHPFFGQLSLRVNIIQDDKLKRPTINGRYLAIPGETLEKMTLAERKAMMAAAALKCGLGHHVRRGSRNKDLWCHASDIITERLLSQDNTLHLPADWPRDPRFTSQDSIESIYTRLYEENPPQGEGEGEDGGKGGGKGKNKGNGKPGKERGDGRGPGGVDVEPPDSPPKGDGGDGEGEGKGQGAGDDGAGDNHPSNAPLTAHEIAQEEQDWRINMIQAANTSKAMGTLPGWAAELVEEISKPKVDWRSVLRKFVELTARDDYNFSVPDRRFAQHPFVLPDLHSDALRKICVAFDTSGSVGNQELDQFFTELSKILEDFPGTEVLLLECDTVVCHDEVLTHADLPIKREARGRGGTLFSPTFRWIRDHKEDIACLVYCTDLGSNDYGDEPPYPVLWVATVEPDWEGKHDNWNCPPLPPFGETVVLEVPQDRGW